MGPVVRLRVHADQTLVGAQSLGFDSRDGPSSYTMTRINNVTDAQRKESQLAVLADHIRSQKEWWFFPSEHRSGVRGFMGTGPVFLVGDQPSTSGWPESHPHRRLLYDTVAALGLADVHITDVYKKRGRSSELRKALPPDFDSHIEFFREEVRLLQPTRVVVMGELPRELVWRHLPEIRPMIRSVRHFGSIVWCPGHKREQWTTDYVSELREAAVVETV